MWSGEAVSADAPGGRGLLEAGYLDAPRPVPTGVDGLDEMLGGGLWPGVNVLGGASSMGKSALACQVAAYVAATGQRDVVYVSAEMGWADTHLRMCASWREWLRAHGRTSEPSIPWGGRALDEWRESHLVVRTADGPQRVAREDLPFALDSDLVRDPMVDAIAAWETGPMRNVAVRTREQTAETIARDVGEACVARRGRGMAAPLLVVDYVQLVPPDDGGAEEYQSISATMKAMQRLAIDNEGLVVLGVSSLNRQAAATQRGRAPEPDMSWLAGSGYLGYSAETVTMITPVCDEDDEPVRGMRRLTVVKNKRGEKDVHEDVRFDGTHNYMGR